MSDMLANTSGIAIKDHYSSIDLCDAALIAACDLLKPGGNFICKFYTGKEDALLEKRFRKVFHKVLRYKPQACRDESKETYMIGMRKRQNVNKVDVFS
ncbi:2' O-ribose methyltransferase [Hanseniaspora vineae]